MNESERWSDQFVASKAARVEQLEEVWAALVLLLSYLPSPGNPDFEFSTHALILFKDEKIVKRQQRCQQITDTLKIVEVQRESEQKPSWYSGKHNEFLWGEVTLSLSVIPNQRLNYKWEQSLQQQKAPFHLPL